MFKINPYRPGAGLMPTYLAGRDADMDAIRDLLDALKLGIPTQSVIFSGLRGVGKTVLINKLQEIAEEKGIKVQQGVYIGTQGPTFETPSEYKLFCVRSVLQKNLNH